MLAQRAASEALARANGTFRRASGWAGEKVARSGRSISPIPEKKMSNLEGSVRGVGVDEVRQIGILLSYTDKEMDEETARG